MCIGSSCHLKGSRRVIERLQSLIEQNNLKSEVELCGAFCLGNCENGVCLKINDEQFSLQPENTDAFFANEIEKRLHLTN